MACRMERGVVVGFVVMVLVECNTLFSRLPLHTALILASGRNNGSRGSGRARKSRLGRMTCSL